jgi:hypothetical protein
MLFEVLQPILLWPNKQSTRFVIAAQFIEFQKKWLVVQRMAVIRFISFQLHDESCKMIQTTVVGIPSYIC